MSGVSTSEYTACYDTMTEGKVLLENRIDLKSFKLYGFDFYGGFKSMGWENYFFWKQVEVLATAIKEFWGNARLHKGGIFEGTVRGYKFVFTITNISEVIDCPCEGIVYYSDWADAFHGLEKVNEDLFENYKRLKDSGETLTSKHLKSHYRVLHKIITKSIWLKAGSSDIVNYEQKFIMRNYMAGHKVNLPRLIYNNLIGALVNSRKGVTSKKNTYKGIPYGVLLTEMMARNLVVNKLTALPDEEKVKYFGSENVMIPETFGINSLVRMKLITGDQMKKVKEEQIEESIPSGSKKSAPRPIRSSVIGTKRASDSPRVEILSKKQKVAPASKKATAEDEDLVPISQILRKQAKSEPEKPAPASGVQKKAIQHPPTSTRQKLKRLVRLSEVETKVLNPPDDSVSIIETDDSIPAPPISVAQPPTSTILTRAKKTKITTSSITHKQPIQTQTNALTISTPQTSSDTSLTSYISKLHSHPFNLLFKIPPHNPFKPYSPPKYNVKVVTPKTTALSPNIFVPKDFRPKFVRYESYNSIYNHPTLWHLKTFTSGVSILEIPPPMNAVFKEGKNLVDMSFKGRLRPKPDSRAIPFFIDLPRFLPQNEPLTLEECGRWITEAEACMMAHCYEQKRLEVIGQYRDPSSVSIKIVPDRQRWLPWSIPGKRKEAAPGKMPFSRIGPTEYEKAPRDFNVKQFAQLPTSEITEDHARRFYLSALKKDQWRTGSSSCCNAEKATIPTVGIIKRVPESNLGAAHFDDMFMCSVIRPLNIVKLYAIWDLIWKHFYIGFSWMQWSASWKDKAIMPCFKPLLLDEDDKERLRRLYFAETEGLNFAFDALSVFLSNVFGEATAEKFHGYTRDIFQHREMVFNYLLFPEVVEERNEALYESERRKLGTIIKWFPPGDNYFQWAKNRKKVRSDLSTAVIEEHRKMKSKAAGIAYVPEAESAPSTSSVEMVTIPKEEFETMKATCLKVPELEMQLKLIMERMNLLPQNP